MRYPYVVILKKDSDRLIDSISLRLCLFSVLVFLYEQARTRHFNYFLSLAGAIVLTGGLLNIFTARKNRKEKSINKPIRYKYWLLVCAVGWLGVSSLPGVGVLFLLMAVLEHQAKRPLEIGVDKDQVVINTLFRRKYSWSAFNNVVLKDGLLTLDFKNNRLLQREVVDDEEEDDADEAEFNDYCRSRLAEASR
jgi:hypothetical protein